MIFRGANGLLCRASCVASPKKNAPHGAFLYLGLSTQDQPPQELGRNFTGTVVTAVPPFRAAELPQIHSERGAAAVMAALPVAVGTKLTVIPSIAASPMPWTV